MKVIPCNIRRKDAQSLVIPLFAGKYSARCDGIGWRAVQEVMKNKFTNSAGDKGRQANFKGFMCGKPLPKAPAGKKGAPEKEARPAPFASRSLLRALLTLQVNPGSRYRRGRSA